MTVSTTTAKSRYTGNGVTLAFTGSFPILDQSHAKVVLTDLAGVETVQTITTHYTISGVGGSTFTVTFIAAPTNGFIVTISRNVPVTQELDLVPNDELPSTELEKSFDKVTMIAQQVNETVSRAVVFPLSDSSSLSAQLPTAANRASLFLKFDANGQPSVADIGMLGGTALPLSIAEGGTGETSASAAFAALKQAASETATGVVEIATAAETTTGTDDTRAITPLKLTTFAPASAAIDLSNDKVLILDASDSSKVKQVAASSVGAGNYFGTGADGALNTSGNLTLDSDTAVNDTGVIIKNYTSVTINSGHKVSATYRSKVMLIYATGNVSISGTLTMSNKGAAASVSSDITISKLVANALMPNEKAYSTFTSVQVGGAAGTGPAGGANTVGGTGGTITNGTGGGGGGGSCAAAASNSGGAGAAGTAICGGSGGGGAAAASSGNGAGGSGSANGGTGGTGANMVANNGGGGGGGAGNSGGTGGSFNIAGTNGATPSNQGGGGLLIIVAAGTVTINGGGVISANGGTGGNGGNGGTNNGSGGGGSGGGRIIILSAGAYSNSGTVQANGGAGGAPGTGGAGGATGGSGGAGAIIQQVIAA